MVSRYIAVKYNEAHEIMSALDKVGITYDYYGHDEIWSVIKMHIVDSPLGRANSWQRTYERALLKVGVVEE